MKGKYIYYPVLIFLIYFGLDKTCALPAVKILTQSDAPYLYFEYKTELLDELEGVWKANQAKPPAERKKIFVILGSSRLMYFSYPQFQRGYPDWEMFNFSAPVTAPAYYNYILERILDRGIKPDYVLLEADPFQFNEGSNAFVRSNLAYSFDFRFVFSHLSLFKTDEISTFLAKNLFSGFKYPPDPEAFFARISDDNNRMLVAFRKFDEFQRANRGCALSIIPRENWFERDFPRLQGTSIMTIGWLYSNYKLSYRQFVFLDNTLRLAKENGVKLVLIRPQVSRPMDALMMSDPKLSEKLAKWDERLRTLIQPYGSNFLDLRTRQDFFCNTYVDGSHMALDCYPPLLTVVMRNYYGM